MKRFVLLISLLIFGSAFFAQDIQHQVGVVNIEVPVRVFKGSTFIDDLTIDDFEIYEDNILQKIEAVYLIKKNSIKKQEGEQQFSPKVTRNFVLLFEITEYLPKIEKAIDYFFNYVIQPGDSLMVITPMKTYNFKSEAIKKLPKDIIIDQLKGKLRKDTKLGNSEYWSLISDLKAIMSDSDLDLEVRLQNYESNLHRLDGMRSINGKKLLDFAGYLKSLEGQKHVFLFYQKELIPKIDYRTIMQLESLNQSHPDLIMKLYELFDFYKRDVAFDVDKVKQAFSDSLISIHFLLITAQRPQMQSLEYSTTIRMEEQTEDIFSAFSEMAKATGGLVDSSANAAVSFEKAVEASENYYLLYYSPKNYELNGKFKTIKVKLKNMKYRITHRSGYMAN
jgi:VWFA-related protein